VATDKLRKGLDEQLLEGGGAGAGMSPSVINKLYPKMPGGKMEGEYTHRNVRSAAELEDIMSRGAALPPVDSKNPKKYWTQTSSPNLSTPNTAAATIRAKMSNIKENEPVLREHIQRFDPYANDWVPLKKGGKVKATASYRADGIASRGKTRGRIV
jgi:hypothetical protein